MTKPALASGYSPAETDRARAACLFIATKLGDLMDDIVIVGGLAPSLLINNAEPAHIGTADVDLGFGLALLDNERYSDVAERLRTAGFEPDSNDNGQATFQRWRLMPEGIVVDFLIETLGVQDRPGHIKKLEKNFGAIFVDGLDLAFKDRVSVTLDGVTIRDERATRNVWVCGCGSFLVLKAIAFANRGENKDAYDIAWVLQHFGDGIDDVVHAVRRLQPDDRVARAMAILAQDFETISHVGPHRAAAFLGGDDDAFAADLVGAVSTLIAALGHSRA